MRASDAVLSARRWRDRPSLRRRLARAQREGQSPQMPPHRRRSRSAAAGAREPGAPPYTRQQLRLLASWRGWRPGRQAQCRGKGLTPTLRDGQRPSQAPAPSSPKRQPDPASQPKWACEESRSPLLSSEHLWFSRTANHRRGGTRSATGCAVCPTENQHEDFSRSTRIESLPPTIVRQGRVGLLNTEPTSLSWM